VAKLGDRSAALEPIHRGVRHALGDVRPDVARGLAIRGDGGPPYVADARIHEVTWLGITISPSYVSEPQCNGVIERFMRTLKAGGLDLHRCQTRETARQGIAAVIGRDNPEWLIARRGYRTPAEARAAGCRAAA
jgi:transposase InsO family protein